MRKVCLIFILVSSMVVKAQFVHPTTGVNSEYVGACETAFCGGTYLDNGNVGGNYSNNINMTYRVFCPNVALNCVRLTFNSFDVEPNATCAWDWLTIGNGPTQNSTLFNTPPALASGRICGTPVTPFSYTSTDASGCLTVRFRSDGITNRPGWSANITCVPCAGGPSGTSNSDCNFATPVCNSAALSDNSTGPGIRAEGCTSGACPAGGENFSNWYEILIATSGTLMFTINPFNAGADYDFAVYGPNPACNALGLPIRCNDSGLTGNTGLSGAGTNATEIVTGPAFCLPMNVIAGERYYIVIDSWSPPMLPVGYNLTWGGTATFNCAILPVEMKSFEAKYNEKVKQTDLVWVTTLESNVNYYSVERSLDASNFNEISRVKSYTGNSKNTNTYFSADVNPVKNEINYYRIVTVDKDGNKSISNLQAVVFQDDDADLMLIPNPAENQVEIAFRSNLSEQWEIAFYNANGTLIDKINQTANVPGMNKTMLDLKAFSKGMYFVVINNGKESFKKKLIVE